MAESAAKQQAEERKEKAELWADTKAERLGKLTILWIKATGFREKSFSVLFIIDNNLIRSALNFEKPVSKPIILCVRSSISSRLLT